MHKWTTACLHLNDGLKPKRGASMLLCMTRCPEIQTFWTVMERGKKFQRAMALKSGSSTNTKEAGWGIRLAMGFLIVLQQQRKQEIDIFPKATYFWQDQHG